MDTQQHGDRPFGQRPDGKTTISFFCSSVSRVCHTLLEWASEIGSRRYTQPAPLPGKWHEFLGEYSTSTFTNILVPTRGEWCAFIDNDPIGGMPSSELLVIAERIKGRSVSFTLDDLQRCKKEQRPYAAMFSYCDATGGRRGEGAVERHVAVIWNGGGASGGWEYREAGAPLWFEEVEAYKARKKADRLTPEMLIRYARALGIRLDEGDSFYDLRGAVGLKWTWSRSGNAEERASVILGVAEKINQELGGKWKLKLFHK